MSEVERAIAPAAAGAPPAGKSRRLFAVERLSEAGRALIELRLTEGARLQDIADELFARLGERIGTSSLSRYNAQRFGRVLAAKRLAGDVSAAVVTRLLEANALQGDPEQMRALLTAVVFQKAGSGELEEMEVSRLLRLQRDNSKLELEAQRVELDRKKLELLERKIALQEEREARALKAIEKAQKTAGLNGKADLVAALDEIRKTYYGLKPRREAAAATPATPPPNESDGTPETTRSPE